MIHVVPLVRKKMTNACASIICPVRNMHPQPISVVIVVESIAGKLQRYVSQIREEKSSKKLWRLLQSLLDLLCGPV